MAKYRKKPGIIESVQWTGDNWKEVKYFAGAKVRIATESGGRWADIDLLACVNGAQGFVPVPRGHWIVRNPGDDSDYWPVESAYMVKNYELVEEWA